MNSHPGHDPGYEAGVDRELDLKKIFYTGIGLALLVVVFAALMWFLSGYLRQVLTAADPAPPVLEEARIQQQPPEPRLQTSPAADLVSLRAEEDALLGGYAWVDQTEGTARIPIERAMEIRAAKASGGEQ